mmetsp:Transcript_22065/g.63313  ORF Transcript_22065/g.63313 Transcript_22065/m.63313 type:complete len:388 (+) Transcript_22065:487-1650(+)
MAVRDEVAASAPEDAELVHEGHLARPVKLLKRYAEDQVHEHVGQDVRQPNVRELVRPPAPDLASEVLAIRRGQEACPPRPHGLHAPHRLREGLATATGVADGEDQPEQHADHTLDDDEDGPVCVERPDVGEVPVQQDRRHFERVGLTVDLHGQSDHDTVFAGNLDDLEGLAEGLGYPVVPLHLGLREGVLRELLVRVHEDCVPDLEDLVIILILDRVHLLLRDGPVGVGAGLGAQRRLRFQAQPHPQPALRDELEEVAHIDNLQRRLNPAAQLVARRRADAPPSRRQHRGAACVGAVKALGPALERAALGRRIHDPGDEAPYPRPRALAAGGDGLKAPVLAHTGVWPPPPSDDELRVALLHEAQVAVPGGQPRRLPNAVQAIHLRPP